MTVSMNQMSDCHWMHRSMIDYMGYTMRTEEFRYTEWVSQSPPACYVQYSDSVTDGGLAPEPCSLRLYLYSCQGTNPIYIYIYMGLW